MSKKPYLPDVAQEMIPNLAPLEWVGMSEIEAPIKIATSADSSPMTLAARIQAEVNLVNPSARGIHMSRLYNLVHGKLSNHKLTMELLAGLTQEFLETHSDLSTHARLKVRFQLPILRHSLVSANQGWRTYPIELTVQNNLQGQQILAFIQIKILYSSTCPASAALARQLIQKNWHKKFGEVEKMESDKIVEWLGSSEGVLATPHAQRSRAIIKVRLKSLSDSFSAEKLVEIVESAIKTPVQTSVKREDEQEFALINGQNLMFCEDVARRVARVLDGVEEVCWYRGRFEHFESLHPHNAVSTIQKSK